MDKMIQKNLPTLILASASVYRQQVLKSLNLPFEIIVSEIDESFASKFDCEDQPEIIAKAKVDAVFNKICNFSEKDKKQNI